MSYTRTPDFGKEEKVMLGELGGLLQTKEKGLGYKEYHGPNDWGYWFWGHKDLACE